MEFDVKVTVAKTAKQMIFFYLQSSQKLNLDLVCKFTKLYVELILSLMWANYLLVIIGQLAQ